MQADLAQVAAAVLDTIGPCHVGGIVIGDAHLVVPAARRGFASELLEMESRLGGGPCREALVHDSSVRVDDLGSDIRWPEFGTAATVLGIRSALAVPLEGDPRGALYLYAQLPNAFDEESERATERLAELTYTVVTSLQAADEQQRNLFAALDTRELIGQAQGVLMERRRVSANQAFEHLKRASQLSNRKLRDVAYDLVQTGEDPLQVQTGEIPLATQTGEDPLEVQTREDPLDVETAEDSLENAAP